MRPGTFRTRLAFIVLAGLALAPRAACAADEEIQVYMDEMNPKGGYGLDLHLNYVPRGRAANVDYAGQMASDGRFRLTPEWSYGLTKDVELGLYLPLATLDRDGRAELGGVKGRIKWIAPRAPGQAWFWGANLEVGRVRRSLDINPWNAELKGILGVRRGPWTVASNLNVDWAISGPQKGPVTYQLATKASYKLAEDLSVGLESYNSLGDARRFGRLGDNDQQAFVVIDKGLGKWDLDLGVGRGWGKPEDEWIVKAIVGVPID